MATGDFHKESDGESVTLALQYTTAVGVAYIRGWLGLLTRAGDSGDNRALEIEGEYQVTVPSGLTVNVGDVVYIDTTAISGTHVPPTGAYGTSSGANKIPFLKATVAKDANNVVVGILNPDGYK